MRTEDLDAAIDLDRRIHELYADHPRVIAIESQGSFLDKLTAVRNAVAGLVREWSGDDPGGGRAPRLEVVAEEEPAPLDEMLGLPSMRLVVSSD